MTITGVYNRNFHCIFDTVHPHRTNAAISYFALCSWELMLLLLMYNVILFQCKASTVHTTPLYTTFYQKIGKECIWAKSKMWCDDIRYTGKTCMVQCYNIRLKLAIVKLYCMESTDILCTHILLYVRLKSVKEVTTPLNTMHVTGVKLLDLFVNWISPKYKILWKWEIFQHILL